MGDGFVGRWGWRLDSCAGWLAWAARGVGPPAGAAFGGGPARGGRTAPCSSSLAPAAPAFGFRRAPPDGRARRGPDAPGYSSCWPWGAGTRAGPGVLLLAGLLADDLAGSSKAAALRGRLGHSGVVGGGDRHVVEWRGVPATWVAGRGDSAQADGEVSASRQAASLLSNEAAAWAGLVEGNARYCSGADGRPGSTWRR